MIPASSDGPRMTSFPSVGKSFKSCFVDLYEQCSLHSMLKMYNSVNVGLRCNFFSINRTSSIVRESVFFIKNVFNSSLLISDVCTMCCLSILFSLIFTLLPFGIILPAAYNLIASHNTSCSAFCTRFFNVSTLSSSSTATAFWRIIGPSSTCSVTMCNVHPVILQPLSNTCWCTSLSMPPLNAGSSDGCMLKILFFHRWTNDVDTIRMYPMRRMRSMLFCSRIFVVCSSNSSFWLMIIVGIPLFFARSNALHSLLHITTFISAGKLLSSIIACMSVPFDELSTAIFILFIIPLCSEQRVLQQHGDCHWSNTARHWCICC